MMCEHGDADGQHAVDEIAAALRASGVQASGLIREADACHVPRTILDAAGEFGARAIVLTSARRRIPIGSVAAHIAQVAEVPVVIGPRAGVRSGAGLSRQGLMVTADLGL